VASEGDVTSSWPSPNDERRWVTFLASRIFSLDSASQGDIGRPTGERGLIGTERKAGGGKTKSS